MDIKQRFKVYCSTNFNELNKSLIESAFKDDNELILEGIASTTSIDEEGDYMTKECLEDMKRQAIGLSILKEHGRKLDDIIGKVIGIPESDSDKFKIKFKVLPSWEWYLKEFIDNDINLGLSIGAKAIDFEPYEESDYGWKVNKAKLYEISLVPLPANWDSFGSVKISKELGDDEVIAKCFNGACKQLVEDYSLDLKKEIEDNLDENDEYVTKKEVLSMINEEGIVMYDRLLSEILDEVKKMNEKNHLNSDSDKETGESDNSNDDSKDNSSNKKEDEEKEKSMTGKIDEKIEEETPNVQKDLEELEGTSGEEIMEKENKVEETVDVSASVDEISNKDVLKGIEDLKDFVSKSIDEKIVKNVDAKVEEIKKEIPDVEELKKELREEIEAELFKDLTTERKPVQTEQPKIDKELETEEVEQEEEINKAMNTRDIAKMLCS